MKKQLKKIILGMILTGFTLYTAGSVLHFKNDKVYTDAYSYSNPFSIAGFPDETSEY